MHIVIKKAIMMKFFKRTRLLEKQAELIEFEIIVSNKYGQGKHSFTLDEVNDQMVLYSHYYFPEETQSDARLIISVILKLALIPYVE